MATSVDRLSAWLSQLCGTRQIRPADDLEAQLGSTGPEPEANAIELQWISRTDLAPISAVEWSNEVENGCTVGRLDEARRVLAGSVHGLPVVIERARNGEMQLLTSTFEPGEKVLSAGSDGAFIPDRLDPKGTESLPNDGPYEVYDGTYGGRLVEVLRRPGSDSFRIREVERDDSGAVTRVKPGAIVKPAREGSAEFVDWAIRLPDASSELAPAIAFSNKDQPNTITKAKATTGSPVKEFPKSGLVEIGKDDDRKFYIPVFVRTQKVENTAGGTRIQDNPAEMVHAEYRPSMPGVWGEGTLVLQRTPASKDQTDGPAVKYDAHNGRWVSPAEHRKAVDEFVHATMVAIDQGITICFKQEMDGALALQLESFRSQVRDLARQAIANEITEAKFQEGISKILSDIGKKGEDSKYRDRADSQISWTRASQVVTPLITLTMGAVGMYLIERYRAANLAGTP
ncbi:hypothetical protein FFK22_011390 [Mycobacterium sp. KBS0706]|uniref:hypothetical protein n=1 Tax=Mycobacterium sp. KBS0706 TaxID=2578109 RepID=UPI00110F9FDF|nr:hypothetical protein [Mycobacterium sp. KBS0706]TSD88656.1 hypothetical protein FFK22_011390 [Mycobacterium sp. KBS0706]